MYIFLKYYTIMIILRYYLISYKLGFYLELYFEYSNYDNSLLLVFKT